MKRYIREGRMGPPMSYKTGAVVETYPKPLLCLQFDIGGLDVVKQPVHPCEVDMKKGNKDLIELCKKPQAELPPITAVCFDVIRENMMTMDWTKSNSNPFILFSDCVNALVLNGCPWKTVVVDNATGLVDAVIKHIGAQQGESLKDARKWAPMVGDKIQQTVAVIQGLKAHTVFILHSEEEKVELTGTTGAVATGEIRISPMIPSSLRNRFAGIFSQFFYATVEGGKAYVQTQPMGMLKGVGARWPANLPAKCGATFQDIYVSEDKI